MKSVRFYYDFSSPYSYLGSTQIEKICREHGAQLTWHPMLLGAVFKAVHTNNVPMFDMSEPKRRWYMQDLLYYAKYYGVPLAMPSQFPIKTTDALRLVLALLDKQQPEQAAALTHRIYRAYWAENKDIADKQVLQSLCNELQLDGQALVAQTQQEAVKQKLFEYTQQAVDAGVFGAPTCLINNEHLIWGQDRLPLVAWLLDSTQSA